MGSPEEQERRVERLETLLERSEKRFESAETRTKRMFGVPIVAISISYLSRHWVLQ
jgi:hypothetical protein